MNHKKSNAPTTTNQYDDDDIPKVDLPQGDNATKPVEPSPESSRPRKNSPGGESGA